MAQRLSTAQVRVLVKINNGERLDATETRSVAVLESVGYAKLGGAGWETTWGGRNFLAGQR